MYIFFKVSKDLNKVKMKKYLNLDKFHPVRLILGGM